LVILWINPIHSQTTQFEALEVIYSVKQEHILLLQLRIESPSLPLQLT
jgi:hypothetical protein